MTKLTKFFDLSEHRKRQVNREDYKYYPNKQEGKLEQDIHIVRS